MATLSNRGHGPARLLPGSLIVLILTTVFYPGNANAVHRSDTRLARPAYHRGQPHYYRVNPRRYYPRNYRGQYPIYRRYYGSTYDNGYPNYSGCPSYSYPYYRYPSRFSIRLRISNRPFVPDYYDAPYCY